MDKGTTTAEPSRERRYYINRAQVRKAATKERFLMAEEMSEYALWVALERRLSILEAYLRHGSSVAHYGDVRIAQEIAAELKERGTQLQLGGI